MSHIILADRYNAQDVIQEEKRQWVTTLLIMLGVPEEEIYEESRDIINQFGIQVWDHLDNGDVEILQNGMLVGKWYAPRLEPKYDENKIIYYEIHLDYDSVIENEFHYPGEDE